MAEYIDIGAALDEASGDAGSISGLLGYTVNGVFKVVDPDSPKNFLVRFANGNWVAARHRNQVPQKPNMPVLLAFDNIGRPYIVGPDPTQIDQFLDASDGGGNVGYHTHVRGSGMEYITDTWLLKQLRTTVSTGTTLAVAEGSYYDTSGALRWFGGDTIDMADYAPPDTDFQNWTIVGLDPNSGDLVAVSGDETYGWTANDKSAIPLVAFMALGYIPLAAIWLNGGASTLYNYQIEDLRYPARLALPSRDDLEAETITRIISGDDGVVLTGDDGIVLFGDL